MAKIQYTETLFGGIIYQGSQELTVNNAHTKAVYTDDVSGDKILISGDNLKPEPGSDNLFASGAIETVTLQRSDGEVMLKISQGNFNAEKLSAILDQDGISGFVEAMLSGKDKIYGAFNDDPLYGLGGDDRIWGGVGNDTIHGGRGDDELWGGKGIDSFVFEVTDKGHDVIHDFDIDGPATDELQFGAEIESIKKAGGGDDTLIRFDNGSTVLLDGIEKADFVDYWNSLN